jgi:Dolichyl-phosphate-mannose-protein mannosyltransferase/F5/8 type C domain
MRVVLAILFGASLTIVTAWSLGAILLRRLALVLYRTEERLLAFLVGSALLSAIMFLLASLRIVHKGVLLALAIASIGYAFYSGAHQPLGKPFPPLPRLWKLVLAVVFGAFTVLYFFNALAPESSPDGMAYHLGEVAKYYRAHGFVRITTNFYGNLTQGVELLFFHAFVFGKHSAAALVHYAFFLCLTFLILSYGRRLGHPAVGVAGAMFFYASPVVGTDGSIAYIDVAVAAIAFALFYLLQVWRESRAPNLLVPIGILAGFAFAVKYTAFVAVPYALAFIAWHSWRAKRPVFRPVLVTAALIAAVIAPWLVKNAVWVDNPISPFGNRLFPNPYMHIQAEEEYRVMERRYELTSNRQIPWQLTVKGDILQGFFGPLFLLTPVALLALRQRAGRQLWLAALVFGLPWFANVGTRFLIPAAPFVSLALALTFSNATSILLVLTLAHAISCWPSVAKRYCGPYVWRLHDIPYKAALRRQSEDSFLGGIQQYGEARLIDRLVPPGERVFTFGQMTDSYTSHEILVGYQSASNEVLRDIIWTPIVDSYQPNRILTFRFAPRDLSAVRVVQTEKAKDAQWNISEMRVFQGSVELPRLPEWRLSAHPNPWDVQMAFDNSPITRWRSWQVAEPGMFVQIDFGQLQRLDAVALESNAEYQTKVKLEGLDKSGKWSTILDHPEETSRPIGVNLRRAATEELKARGIHYILVEKADIRSDDFRKYAGLWGMKCIGEWNSMGWLFQIE